MTINANKKDLRQKDKRTIIYHKSTSDGGALVMMCGRDEEPQSSVATH
jgi:hypothetical protein